MARNKCDFPGLVDVYGFDNLYHQISFNTHTSNYITVCHHNILQSLMVRDILCFITAIGTILTNTMAYDHRRMEQSEVLQGWLTTRHMYAIFVLRIHLKSKKRRNKAYLSPNLPKTKKLSKPRSSQLASTHVVTLLSRKHLHYQF